MTVRFQRIKILQQNNHKCFKKCIKSTRWAAILARNTTESALFDSCKRQAKCQRREQGKTVAWASQLSGPLSRSEPRCESRYKRTAGASVHCQGQIAHASRAQHQSRQGTQSQKQLVFLLFADKTNSFFWHLIAKKLFSLFIILNIFFVSVFCYFFIFINGNWNFVLELFSIKKTYKM